MSARRIHQMMAGFPRQGRTALLGCLLLTALCLASATSHAAQAEKETPPKTNAPAPPAARKAAAASSATNAPATGVELASFKIIEERNIFNPNRASRSGRATKAVEKPKPVKTESFTLAGTMSYAKGDVAFFDSASSEYRKALKLKDKIAGYIVTAISNQKVTLELEGKPVDLAVGGQMRRQDENPWEVVAGSNSRLAEAKTGTDSAGSVAGAVSDLLKKMLQKREEELNK